MALNTSIRGAQIRDLFAGDGLVWAAASGTNRNYLAVSVDNSSIEIAADALQIKALGVTNGMLVGSIADAKLVEDYIKTSEVDGTTVEFSGGSLSVIASGIDHGLLSGLADDDHTQYILHVEPIGTRNLAGGVSAGAALQVGALDNVLLGDNAGNAITIGDRNTFIGNDAGALATTGIENTVVGMSAAGTLGLGSGNTALGYTAGQNNADGGYNVSIGAGAGQGGDSGASSNNYDTFIGVSAGERHIGSEYNVGIGAFAMRSVTTASGNVVAGHNAAYYNETGSHNVVLGREAGYGVTFNSFSDTVLIGYQAGYSLTTGSDNVFIGYQAGYNETTGSGLLYIENSNSTTPLIYGDFTSNYIWINGDFGVRSGNEVRFYDIGNSDHVGFKAPALTTTQIWTLPSVDAINASEALISDSTGTLSWAGHDSLYGFVANEHIDHSTVSVSGAGDLLTGQGGDLTATRTFTLNNSDIDHGSISGLADDDHTQYSLVDGTRAFTGTVGGITPAASTDLATKGYVDTAVGVSGAIDHGNLTGLADNDHLQYATGVAGAPLTYASQTITFNYDGTDFGVSGNDLYVKDAGIDHNATTNYVADEHVAHSTVSISAGGILTGGGTIDSNVTITLVNSSIDHGSISGLADDDHTQYSLVDGTRGYTGTIAGQTPIESTHLATKGYIDSLIQGLDWQESVSSQVVAYGDAVASGTNRYIAPTTSGLWTAEKIYEYITASGTWLEITPDEGTAVWVEDEDVLYVYNAIFPTGTWVKFGSTVTHNNTVGKQGGTAGEYYHLTANQYTNTVVMSVDGDSGTAVPVGNNFNIVGGIGLTSSGSGDNITIDGNYAVADGATLGVATFLTVDFNDNGSGLIELEDTVLKSITTDTGALTIVTHAISILGGEGMDVTHSGTTITVAGEFATNANIGVASFDSNHFSVAAGAVSIVTNGIDDTLIDWGTGAGQVNLDDVPDGTSYERVAAAEISAGIYKDATDTGTKGIAAFTASDFNVTAGVVSLDNSVLNSMNGDTGSATPVSGTINIVGGEGIDTSAAGNTVTVTGEDASDTNKGIASFLAADFDVAVGAVSLEDTVVKTLTTDSGTLTPATHGFSILGGEGMDVGHIGTTITVAGEDASDTNKGIASFLTADFDVAAGVVSLEDTVLKSITTDTGALTIASHAISVLGGEGMDVTHVGSTITVAGEDATAVNKGIASFDSNDFTVTSGNVVIAVAGVDEPQLNISNAPVTSGVLSWDGSNMTWINIDTQLEAVTESDIKLENESANADGVTTAFTLDTTPVANSIQVFLNGLLQEKGSGKDYTYSGTTITFLIAPETGDILLIHYIATA